MKYSIEKDDSSCKIVIKGDINFEASKELKQAFDSLLKDGVKNIVLDLTDVPVSSSTGIGTLLMLYKKLKQIDGSLKMDGIHKNLYSMLKLVKIDSLIDINPH